MSTPTPEPTPIADFFGVPFSTIVWIILIALVALSVERLVTSYLLRFAKRTKLNPDVANNLALAFRILILMGLLVAISRVSGVNADWIVSISAIGGAAVGFASQKTIGNFVAGIFLITAKPFKVGNYVRIGTVEGIVTEITINYTKIATSANNTVSISNLQILDRDVTNFLYEREHNKELYCYTFEIGFDNTITAEKIGQILKKVFEKYSKELPNTPSYALTRSSAGERIYTIYVYVTHPESIFSLRPKIIEEVIQKCDLERLNTKK